MTMAKSVELHRNEIESALMSGGRQCECCGRWAEAHRYTIGASMATALMWLTRMYERTGDWVDVQQKGTRTVLRGNTHGKLRHWGLVERQPCGRDKYRSGIYRPTLRGMRFAHGELSVTKYLWIYNDTVVRAEGGLISIRECFPLRFDFAELMQNIWGHATDE